MRPDVTLSVVGDHMQRLLPRLHGGELDLALVYDDPAAPNTHPPGFTTIPLFDDPFAIVLPPGHPLVRRRPLTLRDLTDETWIGGAPTSTWFQIVRRVCRGVGVEPHVRFTTDDYVAIQALVAADSASPSSHRWRSGPPRTACTPARSRPTPIRRIAVALPPDGHRLPAVQTMIEILRGAGRR